MSWISVKDRLPTEEDLGKEILCVWNDHVEFGTVDDNPSRVFFQKIAFCLKNGRWSRSRCHYDISYWMPLPPPPTQIITEWFGQNIKVKTSDHGWIDMVDELNRMEKEKDGMG